MPAVRDRPVEAAQLVASDFKEALAVRDLFINIGINKIPVRHFGISSAKIPESLNFADVNARGRDFFGSYRTVPNMIKSRSHTRKDTRLSFFRALLLGIRIHEFAAPVGNHARVLGAVATRHGFDLSG